MANTVFHQTVSLSLLSQQDTSMSALCSVQVKGLLRTCNPAVTYPCHISNCNISSCQCHGPNGSWAAAFAASVAIASAI